MTPPPGSYLTDPHYFFFVLLLRFGRCVKADAAAVFCAGVDFGLRSTFDAAVAARLEVTSELRFAISTSEYVLISERV